MEDMQELVGCKSASIRGFCATRCCHWRPASMAASFVGSLVSRNREREIRCVKGVLTTIVAFGVVTFALGLPVEAVTVIASYEFATAGIRSSSDTDLNSTASDISTGSGVSFSDSTIGNPGGGVLWNVATETTEAAAIAGNDYATFTVTPNAFMGVDLSTFQFDFRRINVSEGANNYSLRVDENPGAGGDNFATQIGTGALPNSTNWNNVTVDLSTTGFLQDVTATTTFRLYMYDYGGGTSLEGMDNVQLIGMPNLGNLPQPHLASVAVPRLLPSGAPQSSDVIFSPRFGPSPDFNLVLQRAEEFRVTRFDWVYSIDTNFIAEVVSRGYTFGGTISPSTPDWGTGAINGNNGQRLLGRVVDYNNNFVTAPWFPSGVWWGDVNSTDFRFTILENMKAIVDGGGDRIQVDDPQMSLRAIEWGGTYGPESMVGFRDYLGANTTASLRTSWGLPADLTGFDYRVFVQGQGGPGGLPSTLTDHFVTFHQQSLEQFYQDMDAQIDAYAGRDITFSANNYRGVWDDFSYGLFDNGIAELPLNGAPLPNASPASIVERLRDTESRGKSQAFTLPSSDVSLNQKVLATTYAAGGQMVVPWNVFVPNESRFFGAPADFGDLYGLVRDNASLFDGYEDAAMIGPDLVDPRGNADPVTISGSVDSQIYAFTRAVPGDENAPIVVHLVDWDDTPNPFAVLLLNEMFGFSDDEAFQVTLLLPGQEEQILIGTLVGDMTQFNLPAVMPWGILVIPAPSIPGDFNLNGQMDGADFLAWQRGESPNPLSSSDLSLWETNYGASLTSSASTAVPEPASAVLLLLAGGGLFLCRRHV